MKLPTAPFRTGERLDSNGFRDYSQRFEINSERRSLKFGQLDLACRALSCTTVSLSKEQRFLRWRRIPTLVHNVRSLSKITSLFKPLSRIVTAVTHRRQIMKWQ